MGEPKLKKTLPTIVRPYLRDDDRKRFIIYMNELEFTNQSDMMTFLLDVYEESQNKTELKNMIEITKAFRKTLNIASKKNPTIYKMLMSIVNEDKEDGTG